MKIMARRWYEKDSVSMISANLSAVWSFISSFLIEGSREDYEEETDATKTRGYYCLSREGFKCWR